MTDIEKLERYLCRKGGHDPDQPATTSFAARAQTPAGEVILVHQAMTHPMWVNWVQTARDALDYRPDAEPAKS